MLTATAIGATGLRWNTGTTTPTLAVTQAGTYSVTATFAGGCIITVSQVVTQPVPTIAGDSVLCAGRTGQLTAALPTGSPVAYSWSTGATTPGIAVTQPGIYTATLSYGAGCTATVRQRVRAGGAVLAAFTLRADTTLCEGGQVLLRAPAVGRAVALRWSDGSTGATLRVTQAGTYSLQLTGECDTRTASRRVEYRPCLTIPNIVTANNDGRNDRFAIEGLPLGLWKLEIYSRWGAKVFETAAYQNDWGDQAAAGAYYYLLRQGNAAATYKGWVEVVR